MLEPRRFDIPRFLAALPLFSDVGPAELARLAEGCRVQRFERGEMVFHVGEPCDAFYVVVVGQVKLFMISPSGHEKVIELIGPGRSFAEALMFLRRPYLVNAQVLADTLLLQVQRHSVVAELERDSAFAMGMVAGLSRRLHGLVSDVEAYALKSGLQRVIGYLLREQPDDASTASQSFTVSLPVSKATIASRLSLTPEYFSRVLRELEEAGLIRVDKRDIVIIDAPRLADYHG